MSKREDIARIVAENPDVFSDDHETAHRAASPYAVAHVRDYALAKADQIIALSGPEPAVSEGVGDWPEREKDLAWLNRQREVGHCGESTSDAIYRGRLDDRIDRILSALASRPAHTESDGSRPQEAVVPTQGHDTAVVGREIFLGGRAPSAGFDLRELGFVGTVSEEAKAEITALDRRAAGAVSHPSFFRPIGMQDVRLRAGEGKLSATDVLAAVNAELTDRYGRVIQAVTRDDKQPGTEASEGRCSETKQPPVLDMKEKGS